MRKLIVNNKYVIDNIKVALCALGGVTLIAFETELLHNIN